jgi:hypothetical protein
MIAQQLHEQGVAIEIPEEWQNLSQYFDISISPDSTIYVLRPGVTAYAVYGRIQSRCSNVVVDNFDIIPSWDPDVVPHSAMEKTYRLARSLEFDFEDVLNHRIEKSLRFRRAGDRVEGWLLGLGMRPVPLEYGPRKPAPFKLSFVDQFGRPCHASAMALVDRSAKIPEPRVPRSSVFAGEETAAAVAFTQRDAGVSQDLYERRIPDEHTATAATHFVQRQRPEIARRC